MKSLRILLVDDEAIIHSTLGQYLREFGHQVEEAWDGSQGLEYLRQGEYHLVLMDIRMPGMDGLEVLRRARGEGIAVPILMITGVVEPDLDERVRALGAAGVLQKPLRLKELLARIQELASSP